MANKEFQYGKVQDARIVVSEGWSFVSSGTSNRAGEELNFFSHHAPGSSPVLPFEMTKGVELVYDVRIEALRQEIDGIKKALEEKVKKINKTFQEVIKLTNKLASEEQEKIKIRDISYEQAKEEIKSYFQENHGDVFDQADLQEKLGIDIMLVMQVCEELENEGEIEAS